MANSTTPAWAKHPVFLEITHRLQLSAQINLRAFGVSVAGESWATNPKGFHFLSKQPNALIQALRQSARFGRATAFFDHVAGATVFREVSQPDSLHLTVYDEADRKCVIHLDSISIVQKRGDFGNVVYVEDLAVLYRHFAIDKMHWGKGRRPFPRARVRWAGSS
jgi:hypothetical protein